MGKVTTVIVPVLAVALIGTTYWGYKEHQEKNAILIKAENQYQREFHNVTFYMDQLEKELGKTLAVNSRRQLSPNLTNVWRLAYSAQNSIGQLPLSLMPFNKTEAFLSRLGDFSYKTAVRDLDKEPLSEKEWTTLQNLHNSAREIKAELSKVQDKVVNKQLRWMDVETLLARGDDKGNDNSIIDGFKLIDKRVAGYEDLETSMDTQSSEEVRIEKLKNIKGKEVTEKEAKEIALSFIGMTDHENVKVTKNSDKAIFAAYDVSIQDDTTNSEIIIEVTKKGGQVIWMLNGRNIENDNLSLENAEVKATRFIKQRGTSNMEMVKLEQFDHEAIFTYVRNEKGIRIYPDSIVVKVALDNGDIIGYYAEGHVVNQQLGNLPDPKITIDQAKKNVNRNLKIEEESLALIVNDLNQNVLCYEFSGTLGESFYRVYINANNGEEEKVEKLEFISS